MQSLTAATAVGLITVDIPMGWRISSMLSGKLVKSRERDPPGNKISREALKAHVGPDEAVYVEQFQRLQ